MNNSNLPVSEILKNHEVDEPKKRTREDWRKAKELEEARKAGTAPAAVDEEGKDINPHIPQYIASAPWYFGSKGPTLKHQRPQPEKERNFTRIEEHFVRGSTASKATRYRKGACENCGAMTHAKKDCFERPRKVGAKFSGEDIAPDEMIPPDLNLDFDGKRDRWNGFDPEAYQGIVDEFSKVEEAKRQLKEEKLKEDMIVSVSEKQNREGGSEDDEDKYADDADMPGTKVDSKQRITVRNLRIREDVAKYLRNLDPNSAYYDPKTRSMRDNPYKSTGKNPEELQFAGDNFVRYTGDTQDISALQMFAWQAHDKGVNVHLQGDPTKSELLSKEFDVKKHEYKHQVKEAILDKYGGAKHLQAPPRELIFAQTEDYVEYSRHGEVIKGNEKPIVRSKYAEDVYNNNHSSVWGSYWRNGQWGYKCCYSMVKQSYCTGEAGKEANSMSQNASLAIPEVLARSQTEENIRNENIDDEDEEIAGVSGAVPSSTGPPKSLLEQHQEALKSKKKETSNQKKKRKKKERKAAKMAAKKKLQDEESSSSSSDDDTDSDDDSEEERRKKAKKLKKALRAEEENRRKADELLKTDERKRPYNSMYEAKAPTEEEMEAYFMKRHRPEDPMALFLQQGSSK